jgi:ABC-type nitrate/sulfonate/bicarbonate transport system substrate-binding protein
MKTTIILLFALMLLPVGAQQPSPSTSSVQFTWMPSVDPSPITYYLWEGTNSVQYYTNFNVGTNLSATVSNLARGATYYFAVTAVATNGVASLYSTEASFTSVAQPTQPGSFHIIVVTP